MCKTAFLITAPLRFAKLGLLSQRNSAKKSMTNQILQQPSKTGLALSAAFPDLPPRRLFTLAAFAERHQSFLTLPAITNQVFKAKARLSTKGVIPGNGMREAGAIVRINNRVLIDEDAYFRWVDAQQNGRVK